MFTLLDRFFIRTMRRFGIPLLRVSLGVVFVWFGALKLFNLSPVEDLVFAAYPFFKESALLTLLGLWEVLIGIGLVFKLSLRFTLFLLWTQLIGTFIALFVSPSFFFQRGNPFSLTLEGEFVVKNLVLLTAGIAVGGHEVKS